MTDVAQPAAASALPGYADKSYRAYVLGALLVVYTFNFIDRVVIGIIQEPIKEEFGLTDLQLGLLGGPAFAVLYTFLGIPIARLAERANRVTIISVAVAVWSAMTALCGFAGSYLHLLLARIGVSVGEAGCTPPAHSLLSDYFPPERRATALSVYALGIPIGSLLAAVGGGWIAENIGWRQAFLVLGLPGLALAILVKLTVREPPRTAPAQETPSFGAALKVIGRKRTFWHVAIGAMVAAFAGYGVGQYLVSFMMRTHGLSLGQASQLVGIVLGVFAAIGTFLSGFLADRISKRHPNALSWLPALGFLISAPAFVLAFLLPSIWWVMPPLLLGATAHYFYLGPMFATVQGVAPARMRATATALLLFVINLLGYGLGPPLIGALSDALANVSLGAAGLSLSACAAGGEAAACAAGRADGLRWAMIIFSCGYLWAGAHFLLAGRTLRRDWEG